MILKIRPRKCDGAEEEMGGRCQCEIHPKRICTKTLRNTRQI